MSHYDFKSLAEFYDDGSEWKQWFIADQAKVGELKGKCGYKIDFKLSNSLKDITMIKAIFMSSSDDLVNVSVWNFSNSKYGSSFTMGVAAKDTHVGGYWELSIENLSRGEHGLFVFELCRLMGPYSVPVANNVEEVLSKMNAFGSIKPDVIARSRDFSYLSRLLPGFDQVETNPVSKLRDTLCNIIINLNDVYTWTREEIADWIETLNVVPTFKAPPERQPEEVKELTITIIRRSK